VLEAMGYGHDHSTEVMISGNVIGSQPLAIDGRGHDHPTCLPTPTPMDWLKLQGHRSIERKSLGSSPINSVLAHQDLILDETLTKVDIPTFIQAL
jgi:hypothetical protein